MTTDLFAGVLVLI